MLDPGRMTPVEDRTTREPVNRPASSPRADSGLG